MVKIKKIKLASRIIFSSIKSGFNHQVYPKEFNLFCLIKNLGECVVEENGVFKINNTELTFPKSDRIPQTLSFLH